MDAGTALIIAAVSGFAGWLLREVFLYREDEKMEEMWGQVEDE